MGVGLIGIAVPLLPTTVFVLLAAFFFARSSERLHRRLLENKRFGPMIRDYQAGLGIPARAKAGAVAAIALSFGITMLFVVTAAVGRLAMAALGIGVVWFILSRPTRRPAAEDAG